MSSAPDQAPLRQQDVVRFLLDHGLLDTQTIVTDRVVVEDSSRKNRNFSVVLEKQARGYFLKQAVSREDAESIRHEARVYQALGAMRISREDRAPLPRCYLLDESRGVLVLSLTPGARDVASHFLYRGGLATAVAGRLGRALADTHSRCDVAEAITRDSRPPAPWILSVHRPVPETIRRASQANVALVRLVQQDAVLVSLLDELRHNWATDAFIHGDLRLENCLIFRRSGSERWDQLQLVDWEFAGGGEAAWDLGCVFGSCLATWIWSIPIIQTLSPESILPLARTPVERVQPALQSFWGAYVRTRAFSQDQSRRMFSDGVRYTVAKLLLACFEHLQYYSQLTPNAVLGVQLAANIARRPQEAAALLFGSAG
jgi:aminoglycoside phosphotransferase (APT) family kinase protein